MKGIAVLPGKADSIRLVDLPEPSVDDTPADVEYSSRQCTWV